MESEWGLRDDDGSAPDRASEEGVAAEQRVEGEEEGRPASRRRALVLRMLSSVFGTIQEAEDARTGSAHRQAGDSSSSDQDEPEPGVSFDTSRPAAHTYLGDREDMEGTAPALKGGETVHMPILRLSNFTLFPGQMLPLRVHGAEQCGIVAAAMESEFPTTRLLAVASKLPAGIDWRDYGLDQVACTAEVRQLRREEDRDCINCVVVGRQRAIISSSSYPSAIVSEPVRFPVKICYDIPARRLPSAVNSNMAHWGRWAYKPFDAYHLATQATKLVIHVCPKIKTFEGSPLELSYWLAAHLPFDLFTRQKLLAIEHVVDRLKEEISLIHIRCLAFMRCVLCRNKIADSAEVIEMCDSGPGSAFVNSYGAVHGLITLSSVERQAVELIGQPETEFSWFPGYAWTIMECGTCGKHLGWRFTATRDDLRPKTFWGLSIASIHT